MSTAKTLSKQDILAFSRSYDTEAVPEWGDEASVRLQTLTAYEASQYESSLFHMQTGEDGKTKTEMRMEGADIRLCELAMVDDAGKRLFKDGELKESNAPAAGFKRLAKKIREMNGMGKGAAEEAEGN